jgi:Caspase domain
MFHFSKHWIIVLMLCMTAILANAQKLHMFIVADDMDQGIGSSYDFGRMQSVAQDVATKSGLSLVPYYCKKSQTTSEQLVSKLVNLNCGSDDVVWFYYSGHGFNDGGTFTAFTLPDGVKRFKMETVENKIKSKNPRLAIIMYDACNWISGSSNGVIANRLETSEASCKKLFRNSSGIIKVASNTAGERKFSYGNSSTGGFFTSAFVESLSETDGDWNRLLASTKMQTQTKASAFNREQIPYCILTVNQNPSIAPPPNSNNISGTPDEPGGADF